MWIRFNPSSPSFLKKIVGATLFILFIAVVAALSNQPVLAGDSHSTLDGKNSWKVVRGDATAWHLAPASLECSVTKAGPHWVISSTPIVGDYVIEASIGPAFEKGEGIFFSASSDLSSGYLFTPGVSTHLYKFSPSGLQLVTTWPLGYGTRSGVHKIRILKTGPPTASPWRVAFWTL